MDSLNNGWMAQNETIGGGGGGANRRFWETCFHLPIGQPILEFPFFEFATAKCPSLMGKALVGSTGSLSEALVVFALSCEPLAQNPGIDEERSQKELRISALILEAWFWVDHFNTGL